MKRPTLKEGDLVKLTKTAVKERRVRNIDWNPKTTLLILGLDGDGAEALTMTTCSFINDLEVQCEAQFYRKELWFTGKNIFGNRPKVRILQGRRQK